MSTYLINENNIAIAFLPDDVKSGPVYYCGPTAQDALRADGDPSKEQPVNIRSGRSSRAKKHQTLDNNLLPTARELAGVWKGTFIVGD